MSTIKLVYFEGKTKINSIKDVPDKALDIVKKYEPLFDDESPHDSGFWQEFSDLTFEACQPLIEELRSAGFDCEFARSVYVPLRDR